MSGFRDAIAENRFSLFAQEIRELGPHPGPQRHYEILLRMRDEHGAIIEPAQFVPAAERYGLMIDLDRWVVGTLLRDYIGALRATPDIAPSVNLSANSLSDPRLWPFLRDELRRATLAPGRLSLEITYTALICRGHARLWNWCGRWASTRQGYAIAMPRALSEVFALPVGHSGA
ncbi:EAL domain-containing protein [Lysobacter sp. ISL-50]|uniref:EAL domain-containing protein n=1 Tax=unclassified Lysobacter TaxID=2635362 RepID=UPI001BECFBE7|nr:EAL domain-containing protein [Lysobacter sp. ISL-42]MBT2753519.1 EAL domain-containing protein [Lysobacter sp. ISL-50]MBT2777097.1 EAL domain-containing protein [Lysobacter sp. ISL-54]MBT2780277.1 EAL domain-containing protein [Lysobacter sp. ISL-52]